jgi:putative addiction module component (TIGR02574 family)
VSSATMTDVSIDQLRGLPLEKRLEIIEALSESVESEAGPFPISDEFADELDRRFQEHVDDPGSSIPWEQVRAEIRRQLR